MFLDNENYKLLLIILCKIENMAQNIYIAITVEKLSNGAIFNDLEQPLTQFSRSRNSLTLTIS